jgi:hypothetical protein
MFCCVDERVALGNLERIGNELGAVIGLRENKVFANKVFVCRNFPAVDFRVVGRNEQNWHDPQPDLQCRRRVLRGCRPTGSAINEGRANHQSQGRQGVGPRKGGVSGALVCLHLRPESSGQLSRHNGLRELSKTTDVVPLESVWSIRF